MEHVAGMLNILLIIGLMAAAWVIGRASIAFLRVWRVPSAFKLACVLGVVGLVTFFSWSEATRNPADEWAPRFLGVIIFALIWVLLIAMTFWMLWTYRSDPTKARFRWPRWLYAATVACAVLFSGLGLATRNEWLAVNAFAGILVGPLLLWMIAEPIGNYRYAATMATNAIKQDPELRAEINQNLPLRIVVDTIVFRIAALSQAGSNRRNSDNRARKAGNHAEHL